MKNSTAFLILIFCFICSCYAQNNPITENTTSTKIILVRHAEKADDGTKNPPLSPAGTQRATKLNTLLADVKIDSLYATPYKRSEQTLETIATTRNLKIVNYNPSDKLFSEKLLQYKGKTMLVVGHSNTIPELANMLMQSTIYKQLAETEFGKIWILTFKNNEFVNCDVLNY
jgi:2,3-bisphosphoglycerate-dependent phosphoglycerate mutase